MCLARPSGQFKLETIVGELHGSNRVTCGDVSLCSPSPAILLCRQSLARGIDSNTSLALYRDNVLALRIRSIGEGANLEVSGTGVGFIRRPARPRARLLVRSPSVSDAGVLR
jgi:hypothetical protein